MADLAWRELFILKELPVPAFSFSSSLLLLVSRAYLSLVRSRTGKSFRSSLGYKRAGKGKRLESQDKGALQVIYESTLVLTRDKQEKIPHRIKNSILDKG